jgi:hypothetical protein
VDDGAPTQIEEVFAQSAITGTSSLPPANMGQRMLHGDPFTESDPSFWRQLALS